MQMESYKQGKQIFKTTKIILLAHHMEQDEGNRDAHLGFGTFNLATK